jgi:hypothetical protein
MMFYMEWSFTAKPFTIMKLVELQKHSHLLEMVVGTTKLDNLYAEDFHYINTGKQPDDIIFVFNLTGNAAAGKDQVRQEFQNYLAGKENFESVRINCGFVRRHILMLYGNSLIRKAGLRIFHQENEYVQHRVYVHLKDHDIIFTVAC